MAAPKGNKGGRPTRYNKEVARQTKIACELGATDKDLARLFAVTQRTIDRWKKAHPDEFCQSMSDGKEVADAAVIKSLFKRATGYSHPDTKFASFEGVITDQREYIKHYPADTSACMFWLCNRQPENWKRNGAEGTGSSTADLAEAFMKLSQVLPT